MSGWDYGPGNMNDPGVNYHWEPSVSGGGGGDFWSGLGNATGGLLNIWADTWSKKTLMQQAQEGQRYIEGQQMMYTANSGASPLILLLGAGLIFVMATK